jgi:penicillin amidase
MDGDLHFKGISKKIEIFRDRWGVPHIYAQNLHDLLFGQGFVHAQDRLWQMEFNRRLVAGRLSEVLGEAALPADRWLRTLTIARVANFEVSLLEEPTLSYLQAYVDGINAFICKQRLPIEFMLLRYKPEPWQISDTLGWIKMMAWSLSVNWEAELVRTKLINLLGQDLAAALEAGQLDRWRFTIPPGGVPQIDGASVLERARKARPFMGPSPYQGLGSNNWVVSGSRTKTGMPLLANDMHLAMSIPAIWYENHLVCCPANEKVPELNSIGVTFPGIPLIVSGHNGAVAWGFTNGFPDVQDLYIERLREKDDGQKQAEYNGEWEDILTLKEVIHVKDSTPVTQEVLVTRHGPIINSLAADLAGEQPLALRWTALEPDTMIEGLFDMVKAKNCEEFHHALQKWTAPVQNVVHADTSGNIAYTYPGKIPLRAKGQGKTPVPGWTNEYEWIGYIPFDTLPHRYNPPEGFIATANNRTIAPDYPIPIDIEAISGDRHQRIVELIESVEKIDIPYIQRMQLDQISPAARIFAPYLKKLAEDLIDNETELSSYYRLKQSLEEWAGDLAASSIPAAIYQLFIRQLAKLILVRKFNELEKSQSDELITFLLGKGPNPVLANSGWFSENWLTWLCQVFENDDGEYWFDASAGESRSELLRKAFLFAIDELKIRSSDDSSRWSWGNLHQLRLNHILGTNPNLSKFFNRGPFPLGGDSTTIWATGAGHLTIDEIDQPGQVVGPPYRMIIDLGDLCNSISTLAPGQSGSPTSKHYDDQVSGWFDGKYHPMVHLRQDVEKNSLHLLKLLPITIKLEAKE